MKSRFCDTGKALFRSEAGEDGSRYSPRVLAAVVDALREMAHGKSTGAVELHERFLKRLLPVLAFSELGGNGELLAIMGKFGREIRNGFGPKLCDAEFGTKRVNNGFGPKLCDAEFGTKRGNNPFEFSQTRA